MGRFLLALALLAALVVGFAGASYWRASQGLEPAALEAKYTTPADRFVELSGVRVRVRDEGPEGAPVVLLIHGFTLSLESWNAWATNLKRDYRVVRYDLLGHGLTGPDPEERYAPQARAAFARRLLDELGIDRAAVVGNSLGGVVAWRLAAAAPDRVSALILISAAAFAEGDAGEEPSDVPAAMRALLLAAPEVGVRAIFERSFGDDAKIDDARVRLARDMMRRRGNGPALVRHVETYALPDPTAALGEIAAPTLVMSGEDDAIVPLATARGLADAIDGARLVIYPGVGHLAHEEIPAVSVLDARALLAQTIAAE